MPKQIHAGRLGQRDGEERHPRETVTGEEKFQQNRSSCEIMLRMTSEVKAGEPSTGEERASE